MSFGKSLIAIREAQNISRKDFAAQLAIPYTTLRNYETGQREPGHKLLVKMASLLSVSTDELLGHCPDKAKAPALSGEALDMIKDYHSLDQWGKQAVRSVLAHEKARCKALGAPALNTQALGAPASSAQTTAAQAGTARPAGRVIPLRCSAQPASAGTGLYLGPEEFTTLLVQENEATRQASFCVPVSGDSMEPRYHHGDLLMIDAGAAPGPGDIGLFTVDGEGYVKACGAGCLVSLNPAYPNIPLTEDTRCNGKVIGVLKPDWVVEK